MKQMPIRRLSLCLFALAALALQLTGCGSDGHFTFLGYTTAPLYDLSIRSVRLPIFKNTTMFKGIEFDLTEAVKTQIQAKTPFRVVQDKDHADTELLGTVTGKSKAVVNYNQLGEVREAELTLTVELVWRDLRPGARCGDILSKPLTNKPGDPLPPPPLPGAVAPPVIVQSIGSYVPELGGSTATAQKQAIDRLAVQIVSMMEKPW
jgi:hypothetical protein